MCVCLFIHILCRYFYGNILPTIKFFETCVWNKKLPKKYRFSYSSSQTDNPTNCTGYTAKLKKHFIQKLEVERLEPT